MSRARRLLWSMLAVPAFAFHGTLNARDYFLELDVESLSLYKKFPIFASAGCVRTTMIPNSS
ncbi:MAG: hypothetical protein LBU32_16270 [Clostridiales bacterium]|nr:hypothetical protein [Clostridiales bacterium]